MNTKNVQTRKTKKCSRCLKEIRTRDFLNCSQCQHYFDIECANVSIKRFLIMTPLHKSSWKCLQCVHKPALANQMTSPSKVPKQSSKMTTEINNTYGPNTNDANIPSIIKRKNVNVNKAQPTLTRSCSLESVDTLNTTCSDFGSRSYDLSTHADPQEMSELKEEILQLNSQLSSTQNELDNTILENIDLKKIVADQQRQLSTLKEICKTPVSNKKAMSTCKKKKKRTQQLLNTPLPLACYNTDIIPTQSSSPININHADSGKTQQSQEIKRTQQLLNTPLPLACYDTDIIPTQSSSPININLADSGKAQQSQEIKQSNMIPSTSGITTHHSALSSMKEIEPKIQLDHEVPKKKIYILGGKQCKGLRQHLEKSRQRYHDDYDIVSYLKPNADSENITESEVWMKAGNDDRVILSLGEHDSNPAKIMIELCTILKRLRTCPLVVVMGVICNRYLNEYKINAMLRDICKNFSNCSYLDLNSLDFSYRHVSKVISNNVNSIIDQFDHLSESNAEQEACLSISNTHMANSTIDPTKLPGSLKSTPQQKDNIIKKGTIPFYFKPVIKDPANTVETPAITDKCFRT